MLLLLLYVWIINISVAENLSAYPLCVFSHFFVNHELAYISSHELAYMSRSCHFFVNHELAAMRCLKFSDMPMGILYESYTNSYVFFVNSL